MPIATVWPIDHACGHTADVDLGSKPAGDRARLAAWYAKRDCLACFKEKNPAENTRDRDAELAEAVAAAEQFGLPPFAGTSDKAIAWGTESRHRLIRAAYTHHVEEGGWSEDDFETRILAPARVLDRAGWWIDNRDTSAADLEELVTDAGGDPAASSTENPY